MSRTFIKTLAGRGVQALLLLLCGCRHPAKAPPQVAQLVLRDAKVYTLDGLSSKAEALAVSDGRIVFVGSNVDVAAWSGPATRVIDLKGRTVLPGFHDAHVHPVMGGVELGECRLSGLGSREKVFEAIKRYAADNPKSAIIRGGGWDLPLFPDANPQKKDLDALIADRPAYLVAADMHSAWVNSSALKMAGINKDTKDPPGGRIERDLKTGQPSGTLRESAMELVASRLPKYTSETYEEGLRRGLALANSLGITSLHEAWGTKEVISALHALDRRGELTARVTVAIFADPAQGLSQVPYLLETRRQIQGKRLKANTVKIFLDGVIEARTAAMLEPYDDKPGNRGTLIWDSQTLNALVAKLDAADFQVHIHAIGDRAVRLALDAFEQARMVNGPRDNRHEIAHLEVVDPADVPRFSRLGVVANFQPLWAYADEYITKLTVPGLGTARSRRIYPIGSMLKSGARLACGSDWSVSSMNPLEAIQVAVTRRDPQEGPGPAWLHDQLIGLVDAVACYTTGGAYVNFQEKETGSLQAGKAADFIVLDRNIFEIPPHEIHQGKVVLTVLDGRTVYQAPSF